MCSPPLLSPKAPRMSRWGPLETQTISHSFNKVKRQQEVKVLGQKKSVSFCFVSLPMRQTHAHFMHKRKLPIETEIGNAGEKEVSIRNP